jgi:hypothetical protein
MKTLGLSILLASCLTPISLAQEPARPVKDDQAALQNLSPDAEPGDSMQLDNDRNVPEPGTTYCAFMRTYQVRRKHRGSDVVRPAGYTTCVPTKRFELKSAVQVQPEPSPE